MACQEAMLFDPPILPIIVKANWTTKLLKRTEIITDIMRNETAFTLRDIWPSIDKKEEIYIIVYYCNYSSRGCRARWKIEPYILNHDTGFLDCKHDNFIDHYPYYSHKFLKNKAERHKIIKHFMKTKNATKIDDFYTLFRCVVIEDPWMLLNDAIEFLNKN